MILKIKRMYEKLKSFFFEKRHAFLYTFVLLAFIATAQSYFGGVKKNDNLPYDYTHYNNYLIFKQSFYHLIDGVDMYVYHYEEHWDLYKYSPTFALFFGALAWMPDGVGLLLWNLLNVLCLYFGIRMLAKPDREKQNVMLVLVAVEMMTSIQNSQSNALIAGLIVMAFALFEKDKIFLGCLLIALTVYIKLFGVLAFALCLLYPQRFKAITYSIVIMIGLAILPLTVVSSTQLISDYQSWFKVLHEDYIPTPLSLAGVVKAWTNVTLNNNIVLLTGLLLFLIPFARIKLYAEINFRYMMLAMVLLWVIVFSHRVESPTFVIAMTGVALWNYSSSLTKKWRTILVWFALTFISLSVTDIFPKFIQLNYFVPLSVKGIPCVIVYFVAFYELMFKPNQLINRQ